METLATANGHTPLRGMKVAIPGKLTSAFLTLQLYDADFTAEVVPFDEIGQAVLDGKVDAGLLIHEGQLFYKQMGLDKVLDLGEWWHERTGLPLPMGGNAIKLSYTGTVKGDEIPMKVSADAGGQTFEFEIVAKREK